MMIRCLAIFLFFSLLSTNLSAETIGTSSGGQKCHPVNVWQAESFEWRENGFWNVDPNHAYWVICPLERPYLDPEVEVLPCPSVSITNRSAVDANVLCVFREINGGKEELWATQEEGVVRSEFNDIFGCSFYYQDGFPPPKSGLSSYSVACLLSPGTGITRLQDWWVVRSTPQPDGPFLYFPIDNEVIEQNNPTIGCAYHPSRGYGYAIQFNWSQIDADMVRYHIIVEHIGSSLPLIDTFTIDPSYSRIACNSFVAPHNLQNWVWRVQAHITEASLDQEILSEWSEGSFQFEKCTLSDGSNCNAPAGE